MAFGCWNCMCDKIWQALVSALPEGEEQTAPPHCNAALTARRSRLGPPPPSTQPPPTCSSSSSDRDSRRRYTLGACKGWWGWNGGAEGAGMGAGVGHPRFADRHGRAHSIWGWHGLTLLPLQLRRPREPTHVCPTRIHPCR